MVQNEVVITFPEGGAPRSEDAGKQLDLVARLFRDAHPVVMFSAGPADSQGGEYNNLLLSARRAQAVKEGLVARGIPADRLLLQAFGVPEPANASDPGAPSNRRVVITWRPV